MPHDRLTGQQLDALAKLIRMQPDGASARAARLVLVDGRSGNEAAAETGLAASSVSGAVGRIERALALARVAAGVTRGDP